MRDGEWRGARRSSEYVNSHRAVQLRFCVVADLIDAQALEIYHVDSSLNVANVLTKLLQALQMRAGRRMLGMA